MHILTYPCTHHYVLVHTFLVVPIYTYIYVYPCIHRVNIPHFKCRHLYLSISTYVHAKKFIK